MKPDINLNHMMPHCIKAILVAIGFGLFLPSDVSAQFLDTLLPGDEPQESKAPQHGYTRERPLIYEGAQDLWPYSFLNEQGQPSGYNIDLIKLILKRLDIPYIIRMKPRMTAFRDLKAGNSDLMIGLTAGFHENYGYYSQNAVTLFTQSILSPKSKPTEVRNFRDLANHKVFVNDSSLCHHLMVDYGWADNAIPTHNIGETIKQMSTKDEGELVWNTLSLKWLLRKFHIDNLEITPVDMPHGEYKFMSNDRHLLHLLDSVFAELSSSDQLLPLQNTWFYPERQEKTTPQWVWYAGGTVAFLVLILVFYTIVYQRQAGRITQQNSRQNRQLALILETSGVRIWTYDVQANRFAWRNEKGKVAYTYTQEEFSKRYPPDDYARLQDAIRELSFHRLEKGASLDEPSISLQLKARDAEGGDAGLHDFAVTISVLQRNKSGMPTELIGTKVDVTRKQLQEQLADEQGLRYWAIFNTPLLGIMFFNKDGILSEINQRACDIYCCDKDQIVLDQVSIWDMFDGVGLTLDEMDGFHASQFIDFDRIPADKRRVAAVKRTGVLCNEFLFIGVRDDKQGLIGIFAICRDMTHVRESLRLQRLKNEMLHTLKTQLCEYDKSIDNVLHESDVRLAAYSTKTHMLSIYSSANEVQHELSQTRCMSLVDDSSKKTVMRLLARMDQCEDADVNASILTTLRTKGRVRLSVMFCLTPLRDKNGHVIEYLGLCRDLSELRHIEQRMAEQTAKVQEVESAKNSFVKNMVQEIQHPMNTMIDYVEKLPSAPPVTDESQLSQGILENADYLLHLIDNILYLSRLEAHMVEISHQPCNFAALFSAQCMEGWARYQNGGTRYVVENPYDKLVINIDADNLGQVVRQLTANAAQHTAKGTVRARCEYIGRRLIISVDDTGEGIPADEVKRLNQAAPSSQIGTKGLGLAICREMLHQMNGTIEIISELGAGTTVYVTIPCQATDIKRKRSRSESETQN